MANTILTLDKIAREALMLLRSTLVGVKLFDTRYQANFMGDEKIGDNVRIRRRGAGTVREFGGSIVVDDMTESKVDLTLEKHYDVSFAVTSKQWTLDLQSFSEQLIAPNMLQLAEKVDEYALSKLKDLPYVGGPSLSAPAGLPANIAGLAGINRKLDELKCPGIRRAQVVSPEYKEALLSIDSFVEADKRGDSGVALEMARMGTIMGMTHFMDQNVDSSTIHTSGTMSTATVNGAVAVGGTTITFDGGDQASGTFLLNDIVTIGGYGNVVVAANATATSNAGSFTIKEPVRNGGIADNATITVYDGGGNDRSIQGAAFHPRAFAFASVPLEVPMEAKGVVVGYEGLNVRVIRDYNITTKQSTISLDVLCGATLVDGNLGCQIVKDED